MIVLHEGRLIDDFELYDPELADTAVQVLAWLRELLEERTSERHEDRRITIDASGVIQTTQ